MLHKCANPNCANPFRKLSEGKLFLVETENFSASRSILRRWDEGIQHRIEHFWLCTQCASSLTLAFEKGKGLRTVPLPELGRKPPLSIAKAAAVADTA
jgi:hypothetical protein